MVDRGLGRAGNLNHHRPSGVLTLLYNALWCAALPMALRIAGAKVPADRRERLGYLSLPAEAASKKIRIWLHAASVGEIEGARSIALGLMRDLPDSGLIVTTMTAAGRDAARRRIPGALAYTLAPLDWSRIVRRFVGTVRPKLVIIAETELWPNFLVEAHRAGAQLAILNGRISARSLDRYRWVRPLFVEALSNADLILAQTEDDARRYQWLGAAADRIIVAGNTKYDLEASQSDLPHRPELEAFAAGKPILIAGSTAPGEEEIVLRAYLRLLRRFPDLALVIAPRHLSRLAAVESAVEAAGLLYAKASALASGEGIALPAVLILDTMGELRALYRRASVAFVGGSLTRGRGGQNLAEPAAASVPVLFGPYHETQEQIASALVSAQAGRIVSDSDQLADACEELLGNDAGRVAAGKKARAALEHLAGNVAPSLMRLKALASLP